MKDFFDFFNGRTANIRKNTYSTWGNREIFAGKLLKNIKRAEGWMQMRERAGGKVYERGNTNGTNIANEGAYYVRVIYILYKVRVYVYAKPRVKPIVAPSAVAEVLVEVVDGHHAHAAW